MIDSVFNNFNAWILPDDKDNNSVIDSSDSNPISGSGFSLDTSASWMDPLENILSDTISYSTSDSTGSSPSNTHFLAQVDNFPIKREHPDSETIPTIVLKSTQPVKPKKRAPRKRLTTHQKQAHNKIEKRYRININTKIAKLQQTIPWVASDHTAFEVSESIKNKTSGKDFNGSDNHNRSSVALPVPSSMIIPSTAKLNKSIILEKAVEYIEYLQNNERLYELEVQRLRSELDSEKVKNQSCV